MPPLYDKFQVDVSSPTSGIQIGFQTNSENYILAVVPRFWFDNPDNVPIGILDDSKVLVVPAKGKRKFISLNNSPPADFNSVDGEGKHTRWASVTPTKPLEQTPADMMGIQKKDGERVHALLNLLLTTKNLTHDNSMAGLGIAHHSDDFKVILFKNVIDMVNKGMRELRGVYRQQKIHTSTIQGRIDFAASSRYIDARMPKFVCQTNIFDLNAPHYSALMAAFDHVSSFVTTEKSFLKELADSFSEQARIQRARFREIPSYDRGRAIQTLRNKPLPPQLQKWRSIFKLALVVLEDRGGHLAHGTNEGGDMRYQCSYLWEDIIEEVLDTAKDGWDFKSRQTAIKPTAIKPWRKRTTEDDGTSSLKPIGDKHLEPDFHLQQGELDIVLDAKYYKTYDGNMDHVLKQNHLQFLEYALYPLGEEKRIGPRKLAFVVPHSGGDDCDAVKNYDGDEYELQLDFTITKDQQRNSSPVLHPLSMEFPLPEVYLDEQSRQEYFERTSEKMAIIVKTYFDAL